MSCWSSKASTEGTTALKRAVMQRRPWVKVLFLTAVLLCGLMYSVGAERGQVVNTRISKGNQDAYLKIAQQMARSLYKYEGARMPVYPLLLTLVYADGMSQEEFFTRAKYLNLVLSIVLLLAIWVLLRLNLPVLDASVITLITAFTVFVYKAPYVQCELLFYTLTFTAFVLALRWLRRPTKILAVAVGGVIALAHLTKASTPPGLILLVFWGALSATLLLVRRPRALAAEPLLRSGGTRQLVSVLLLVVTFLVTVFPHSYESKKRFGRWFYNVNSTFYIWYDTREESLSSRKVHRDRIQWPNVPSDQLPSAQKYFREHSLKQVLEREGRGLGRLYRYLHSRFGYGKYLGVYLGLSVLMIARWPTDAWRVLISDRRWLVTGFVLTYMFCYVSFFAFWSQIAHGQRFVLTLFLPVMFSLSSFIRHPAWPTMPLFSISPVRVYPYYAHFAVLALLAYEIAFVHPAGITTQSAAGSH